MNIRCVRILEILSVKDRIKISLLAELLNVCDVTLRKDLKYLEKYGIVSLEHGYVSLEETDYTGKRMAIDHSIKRKIAKAAAEVVNEGETIMLGSGSCCTMLAEELALTRKNINIITNSVFIAQKISKNGNIKINLLGGFYQPVSQALVGPMTKACVKDIYSHKFFLGTNGFIRGYGFSGRDQLHIETAVEMTERAENVFIITESRKFNHRGSFNLIQFNKLSGVFTDENIPKEAEDILAKNNVQLFKVPVKEEKLKWQHFPGMPPILYKEKS